MTFFLGIHLEQRNYLGTGLHAFILWNHTYDSQNIPKSHGHHYRFFTRGYGPPSLEYVETLMAPDGFTLLGYLPMDQSAYLIMRCMVATLLGPNHLAKKVLTAFGKDMRH